MLLTKFPVLCAEVHRDFCLDVPCKNNLIDLQELYVPGCVLDASIFLQAPQDEARIKHGTWQIDTFIGDCVIYIKIDR